MRDIKLALLTKEKQIISFLNNMDCEEFVRIHQENFKDHYLSEPKMIVDTEIFDNWRLFDIICEKYREFFERKGINETHEWLNPSLYSNYSDYLRQEDFTYDMILTELGYIDADDELSEQTNDMFNELYYEYVSGWGLSWFVLDVVDLFNDSYYSLHVE